MTTFLLYMASPVIVYAIIWVLNGQNFDLKKYKKTYIICCVIIMALMIGLRYYGNGSGDSAFYYSNWTLLSKTPYKYAWSTISNIDMEKGYLITAWILSHIFKEPQFLFILSGLFFAVSVGRFVFYNCENPIIGFTVFNCLGLFSFMVQGLRQSIAMCICLFALEQCKKKKLFWFLLLIALAACFHGSAIVFLVVYVLALLKMDFKSYLFVGSLSVVGIVLLPEFFDIINQTINDNYTINEGTRDGTGVIAILIYIVILVVSLILKDKKMDENLPLYMYITFIGLITLVMRNRVSGIAERISFYFAFGQMALLATNYERIDKASKQVLTIICIALCFGVAVYKSTYSPLIPYLFFWQT